MYSVTEIIAHICEFKLNHKKSEDGPSTKIFHDMVIILLYNIRLVYPTFYLVYSCVTVALVGEFMLVSYH